MTLRDHFLILKINLIVWNLLLMISSTDSAHCNETYDFRTCSYKMYCENFFEDIQDINNYNRHPDAINMDYNVDTDNSGETPFSLGCKEESVVVNAQIMNPIHLKYRCYNRDLENIPNLINSYREIFDILNYIVVSLDISNNNFVSFPTFWTMSNLKSLNLSNNFLTSAKLSNDNPLESLKEIDLSFNTIRIIYVDRDKYPYFRIKKINLSHNYLVRVPAVFDMFSNLTYLDLSYNFIDTLGPITFEGIKKLAHLNMSYNRISDINASLFRFSDLETLDLSNNKLEIVRASDFDALTKLVNLNLKSNIITSVEVNTFQNLKTLQSLELSDNKIDIIDKELLNNVENLIILMMSKNRLKTLPKGLFKGKQIKLFSIVDNSLEGSIKRGIFEGLQITQLDLSNQRLGTIENNAFYGLDNLKILLLQNNNIKTLAGKCFKMLIYLKQLDLSYNQIENIAFEKENLGNLESLSISNNYLTLVKSEHFQGLDSLQYLDLSNNKISKLESNSFQSLKNLISFEISNNPLNGTLEKNTFEGLNSLPSLDISSTLLNTIKNGSFNGMVHLKNVDVSRSEIRILEYNSFIHTGSIRTLNLSNNKIKEFHINNTQLPYLEVLHLDYNYIKKLDSQTFDQMLYLGIIFLSHNEIEQIDNHTFSNQIDLRNLDISYNPKLKFSMTIIDKTTKLDELNLSGISREISFDTVAYVPLTHLTISNSSIVDIKTLQINALTILDVLILSHNNICRLESEALNSLNVLKTIDLSYNQITFIQPGAFKENTMLDSLNISHNHLTSITYGIFRGLIYLNKLDISYNNINTLQNERFYELRSLSVLIADHNKIETINAEDFLGTGLSILSIGDNPIPCSILVNLQRNGVSFNITAIKLQHDNENVDGITCNKIFDIYAQNPETGTSSVVKDNKDILINIRDIILTKLSNNDREVTLGKDDEYLVNITNQLSKNYYDNKLQVSNFTELTSQIINKSNETNSLLERILKALTLNALQRPTTPTPIVKDNATFDNLVNYMNKLKQHLEETISFEKNNIMNEVENRLKTNELTNNPVHENLINESSDATSIFTETCVGLILLILVCLVLYKVYKSGLFFRRRLSISTRELPDAMDSTL